MTQQVSVTRKELPAPDISDMDRKIVQITYQLGELPPRFLYIPKKEYSKEAEAKAIKADIEKMIGKPAETITIGP